MRPLILMGLLGLATDAVKQNIQDQAVVTTVMYIFIATLLITLIALANEPK